ncbi:hypothetical protein EV714DRAFT_235837 [Schizophyllum commune]
MSIGHSQKPEVYSSRTLGVLNRREGRNLEEVFRRYCECPSSTPNHSPPIPAIHYCVAALGGPRGAGAEDSSQFQCTVDAPGNRREVKTGALDWIVNRKRPSTTTARISPYQLSLPLRKRVLRCKPLAIRANSRRRVRADYILSAQGSIDLRAPIASAQRLYVPASTFDDQLLKAQVWLLARRRRGAWRGCARAIRLAPARPRVGRQIGDNGDSSSRLPGVGPGKVQASRPGLCLCPQYLSRPSPRASDSVSELCAAFAFGYPLPELSLLSA